MRPSPPKANPDTTKAAAANHSAADDAELTDYWISDVPENTPVTTLAWLAKVRGHIEHNYRELETGLGLYGILKEPQRVLAAHLGCCPRCQQRAPTKPSAIGAPLLFSWSQVERVQPLDDRNECLVHFLQLTALFEVDRPLRLAI